MIAALLLAAVLADPPATTTTAPPPPVKKDSPLVKAAKASGGKRRAHSKVITNADVKKAGGRLLTLPPGKEAPAATATSTAAPLPEKKENPVTEYEQLRRDREFAAKRVGDAEQKVADLESEARRLEQAYYQENDPTVRDKAIAPEFTQATKQLELARKELADARDALFALMKK